MDTTRHLSTLPVPAVGYGAMVLMGLYGASDEATGLAALRHVLDRGAGFIDTSDGYADNEELVGRALAGRRADAVVATKWGIVGPGQDGRRVRTSYANEILVDARPERARAAAESSLRRLGVDALDLWYLHFPDPGVPVEETVGAMGELVAEGKVRHLGLSNVTAEQVLAAHQAHPIAAVQAEWSLWTRGVERELVPVLRELGIGMVPWGPLGNGFLAGSADGTLEAGDFRHNAPRFRAENLAANRDRFAPLRTLAADKGITPAQLALAWLLAQGDDVVPIPGSRTPAHIDENLAAAAVELSPADLRRLDELAPAGAAAGASLLG
jgi:aryl-alcohol dehydrogenase-like predicted oxidoreductase